MNISGRKRPLQYKCLLKSYEEIMSPLIQVVPHASAWQAQYGLYVYSGQVGRWL